MHYFNLRFNKKFISILGLFIVLCLSMSMVNATDISNTTDICDVTDISNENVDSNGVHFDSYHNADSLVYSYNVSSEADFKKVFNHLKSSKDVPKHAVINIINDIKVKDSNIMSISSKDTTFDIEGNGHSIKVSNPNECAENHFLTCGREANVFIKNLTLSGFNTAIINHGTLNLTDITIDSNYPNYFNKLMNGGAILCDGDSDGGIVSGYNLTCRHCNFNNKITNYHCDSGAI